MKGKLREFNVRGMKLLPYKAAMVHWDFIVEYTVLQAKELFCLFYKSWEIYMREVAWSVFFKDKSGGKVRVWQQLRTASALIEVTDDEVLNQAKKGAVFWRGIVKAYWIWS